MPELSPEENALNAALKLLEAGDKSRRELADRLRQKRYKEEIVLKVLARLEARGFVDDRVFAGRLAEKLGFRGTSQRKMAFDLRRRGVPADIIEEEMGRLAPAEEDRLTQAGLKQWKRHSRLAPDLRSKKVFGFLARQGFDSEPIRRFLDRVVREEKNEGESESYDDHG